MNMWLRMLKVAITSMGKERLHPNHAHSTLRFKVKLTDLDVIGHMNNGKFATLCDLGKLDLLIRTGILKRYFTGEVVGLITDHDINYIRQISYRQKVRLETRVRGWDDVGLTIEHKLYDDKSGKLLATCDSTCKFLENWKDKISPARMWEICNPTTLGNTWLDDHEMQAIYHS